MSAATPKSFCPNLDYTFISLYIFGDFSFPHRLKKSSNNQIPTVNWYSMSDTNNRVNPNFRQFIQQCFTPWPDIPQADKENSLNCKSVFFPMISPSLMPKETSDNGVKKRNQDGSCEISYPSREAFFKPKSSSRLP
jgi:hypothetical protein